MFPQVHAVSDLQGEGREEGPPRRHEGGEFYPGVDPPFIQRDPQFELGRKMITGVHIKFCLETTTFPKQKVGGLTPPPPEGGRQDQAGGN